MKTYENGHWKISVCLSLAGDGILTFDAHEPAAARPGAGNPDEVESD